jgi:hypothetical protein
MISEIDRVNGAYWEGKRGKGEKITVMRGDGAWLLFF